jgi:hypothetical protein
VFKRIKRSMTWEKALLFWEEQGVPIKGVFEQLSFPDKAQIRERARGIQADGAEIEDVATLAACYLFDALSEAQKDIVRAIVWQWKIAHKLHPKNAEIAKKRLGLAT